MCTEIDSKSKIDPNLEETIGILEKNNIPYWLCHGTLLGIVRDNELIPWDTDIDIGVWYSKNLNEKLKTIMTDHEYKQKPKYMIKDDLLTFVKEGGREVDINCYQEKEINNLEHIAYVKLSVPKNSFCKIIDALSVAKNYKGKYRILINRLEILSNFFTNCRMFLINKNLFYKNIGYTLPLILFKNLKKIKFKNILVTVPLETEKYLSYTYGENWRTPNKNYNWIKDSPATKDV